MDEEFKFSVLPSNQSLRFPISSQELIIGFHADITLLTVSDEFDEDARDIDRTTQQRFVYSKDLRMVRQDLQNGNVFRTALVNALTEIEVPESYHSEIVDEVLAFTNDERFRQCGAVSVDIELVKYADDEEEGGDEEEETDDIIEPSFGG